ncbi:MAG: helix-turn-helix transcriptional regulator [Candidatus Niameybacter stercoravium]|nr:helix-turn-helix transcriptional regulator [Candidatus Niameybacter stercoravium]
MIRLLLSKKLGEIRWTQADLARKTGIRPSTINDMYHEICERVSLEHLDLICEALECDLSDIIVRVPNDIPNLENRNRLGRIKNGKK